MARDGPNSATDLAFLSAVATYGIVVFKAYKSRVKPGMKPQQILFMLLGDENVQYLCKLLSDSQTNHADRLQ